MYLQAAEKREESLESEIARLTSECADVKIELEASAAENKQLEEQLTEMTNKVEQLTSNNASLDTTSNQLEIILDIALSKLR